MKPLLRGKKRSPCVPSQPHLFAYLGALELIILILSILVLQLLKGVAKESFFPKLLILFLSICGINNEASLRKCFVFVESCLWNICVEIWIC